MLKKTAVIIPTILRDKELCDCIESIRRYYPNIFILIGSQTDKPKKYKFSRNNLEIIEYPFDLGVSETRNNLVDLAREKGYEYILLADDDTIFDQSSSIEKMFYLLKKDVGVVGTRCLNRRGKEVLNEIAFDQDIKEVYDKEGNLSIVREYPEDMGWRKKGEINYRYADAIMNFALFRAEVFNYVEWDNDIKVTGEHIDFYYKWKKREVPYKIIYTPDVTVFNKKRKDNKEYKKLRVRDYRKVFLEKWGIKRLIQENGKIVELINGEIIYK